MYRYKYIDEVERDIPTLGIRVNKDDIVESEKELFSPFLEEIKEDEKEGEE